MIIIYNHSKQKKWVKNKYTLFTIDWTIRITDKYTQKSVRKLKSNLAPSAIHRAVYIKRGT